MTTLTPQAPPACRPPTVPTATPFERVRRARAILAPTVLVATALWGLAAGLGVLALLALVSLLATSVLPALVPVAAALGAFAWPIAILGALATVALGLWRGRAVWSLERVALWVEERAPELRYALVTAIDPRFVLQSTGPAAKSGDTGTGAMVDPALGAGLTALLAAAGRADLEVLVRRAAGRSLAAALAAIVLTGAAARLLKATDRLHTIGQLAHLVRPGRGPMPLGNRLAKLRAEVVPPAYSGLPRRVVTDPTSVAGLIGSTIRFLGDGPAEGVTAIADRDTLHQDTLAAKSAGRGGWAVPLAMPRLPGVIRFQDRSYHRSVVLEPLPDSAPRVLLRAPAQDTTWRWDQVPKGDLVLEADLEDDYGLTSAYFEILASTGGAENFETKDKSTPRVRFSGERQAKLSARVSFAALGMTEGTVLHIRAVAYDNNTVADSLGKGVSETRTLRVATKQESDTVSVAAAPPLPIDSTWIGQRVLNAMTDTLIRVKQRKLTPQQYTDTASFYADKQELIRQKVEMLIVLLEDDGVGGRQETEPSRLLRQASEQMWQARQYLAIGLPDSAYVPPKSAMKEALRLLELARKAQKYYLRGKLQTRPVDVAEARLKDTTQVAQATDRSGRQIPEDLRQALRARLAAVLPLVLATPERGIDSLMLVRAVALRGGAQPVAAALQEAIDAARHGHPVAAPLTRAQRLLDPPPRVTAGPAEWGGVVP